MWIVFKETVKGTILWEDTVSSRIQDPLRSLYNLKDILNRTKGVWKVWKALGDVVDTI